MFVSRQCRRLSFGNLNVVVVSGVDQQSGVGGLGEVLRASRQCRDASANCVACARAAPVAAAFEAALGATGTC